MSRSTHYRTRRVRDAERAIDTRPLADVLGERDIAYKLALGLPVDATLPRVLGIATGHARLPLGVSVALP